MEAGTDSDPTACSLTATPEGIAGGDTTVMPALDRGVPGTLSLQVTEAAGELKGAQASAEV